MPGAGPWGHQGLFPWPVRRVCRGMYSSETQVNFPSSVVRVRRACMSLLIAVHTACVSGSFIRQPDSVLTSFSPAATPGTHIIRAAMDGMPRACVSQPRQAVTAHMGSCLGSSISPLMRAKGMPSPATPLPLLKGTDTASGFGGSGEEWQGRDTG